MDTQTKSEISHTGFIAVHVGAGLQSKSRLDQYCQTIKRACLNATRAMNNGKDAAEAVCIAVAALEDCSLTNAGVGSNLTLDGKIECDAAIMDQDSYGAVGAVSNIQNPILIAWSLLNLQKNGLLEGGRIPPCFMVGDGAKQWANENGIPSVDAAKMKTENSSFMFEKYKRKLDECSATVRKKIKTDEDDDKRLDTVGAIAIDRHGRVAAAASSGGILLKHSGRVGHSAMFGCGCWAEKNDQCSIATASSGTGEFLMKSLFAKSMSDELSNNEITPETIENRIKTIFLNRPMTPSDAEKYFGFILLKVTDEDETNRILEFVCAHNTQTMLVGYMNTNQNKISTHYSQLQASEPLTININSIPLKPIVKNPLIG